MAIFNAQATVQGIYNPLSDNPNANQSIALNDGDTLTLTDQYANQNGNAKIKIQQTLTGNGPTAATPTSVWDATANTLTISVDSTNPTSETAILNAINNNTTVVNPGAGKTNYNPFQATTTGPNAGAGATLPRSRPRSRKPPLSRAATSSRLRPRPPPD